MASRVGRIFETALLPIGIAALGVLIWQIGPEERAEIVGRLTAIRWWFIAVVALEALAHAANTAGLLACLPLDKRNLGFFYTFASRLSGEAVNAIMPTATVGGELLKISLLSRRAPADRVTAGISAAYATQALAQMMFTMLVLPFALPSLDLPNAMKGLIVLFVVGGLVATFWLAHFARGGGFGRVHGLLQRIGLGREGSRAHTATVRIDDAARDAKSAAPAAFAISTLEFLFGWAWGATEVAAILYAFGLPVDIVQCLAIESLSVFVDAVFFFVPGQMGTREIGLAGITQALRLGTPIGVSIGLIRRGRVLVWASIGMLCLAWLRRSAPEEKTEERDVEHGGPPGDPSVIGESSAR